MRSACQWRWSGIGLGALALLLAGAGVARPQAVPAENISRITMQVIRGESVESQAQVVVVFLAKQGDRAPVRLSPDQVRRLVADPKITTSAKVEATILSLTIQETRVSYRTSAGVRGEGDGYAITCRVRLTAGETGKYPPETVRVDLPAVNELRKETNASLNDSQYGVEFHWDAIVYPSEEAIEEEKRVAAEKQAAQKAKQAGAAIYAGIGGALALLLLVADVGIVIGAVWYYSRASRGKGQINLLGRTRLPDLCVCCGERTKERKAINVANVRRSQVLGQVTLNLPVCDRHRKQLGGAPHAWVVVVAMLGSIVLSAVAISALKAVGQFGLGVAVVVTV